MSYSCRSIARAAVKAGLVCTLSLGGFVLATLPAIPARADIVVSNQKQQDILAHAHAATMTDPSENAAQAVVNNSYHNASDLFDVPSTGEQAWNTTASGDGIWTMFVSARSKDGQKNYTWGGKTGMETRSIVDMGNVDPSTIEAHYVYKNGPKASEGGLLFFIGDLEWPLVAYDASRDITINSASGTAYSPALTSSSWDGSYSQPEAYKKINGTFDNVAGIYLCHRYNMGTAVIEPNDVVEITVPIKFTGYVSEVWHDSYGFFGFWDASTGSWGERTTQFLYPAHRHYQWDKLKSFELTPSFYNPATKTWEHQTQLDFAVPSTDPNSPDLQNILHFNFVAVGDAVMVGYSEADLRLQGAKPATTEFSHMLPSIYDVHQLRVDLPKIESKLTSAGWTVEFRGTSTQDSVPAYFYKYDREAPVDKSYDINTETRYQRHLSVIPALIASNAQHYKVGKLPQGWNVSSLLDHVYRADEPLQAGVKAESLEVANHLMEYDKEAELTDGTITVSYRYHEPGQTDEDNVSVKEIDPNKAGTYKVTFTRTFGKDTPISVSQYVYIDDETTESKKTTRTILLHTPDGQTQTIVQEVTLLRTVSTNSETGETTYDSWSTGTWDSYVAPEFEGWKASQTIDAQEVTGDTESSTVEISYTKLEDITNPDTSHKPGSSRTPKTGDVALATAPIAATGLSALLGSLVARRRRKHHS